MQLAPRVMSKWTHCAIMGEPYSRWITAESQNGSDELRRSFATATLLGRIFAFTKPLALCGSSRQACHSSPDAIVATRFIALFKSSLWTAPFRSGV